jgi:hypothetical protein
METELEIQEALSLGGIVVSKHHVARRLTFPFSRARQALVHPTKIHVF